MKISYSWLKEYIQTSVSAEEAAKLLTDAGLEVESVESFDTIPGGLKGLVIGEVKEKMKHPNADKLSLTKVDIGGPELLSIVCGAPNVDAGQKVVVAPVGTVVHPMNGEPFEIKKSKIRGELSEGMICAEDEISLGTSHDGIMVLDPSAQVGMTASEYFNLGSDSVLEIGLTPNRSDAASHFGVARDLAAALLSKELQKDPAAEAHEVKMPAQVFINDDLPENPFEVQLKNPEACIRYSGIYITGIKVGPSPEWLQTRLSAIGVRSVNNVVDVTNYVLHELGQPLHAFDADKIAGKKVVVKKASEGERFVTLDGTERQLTSADLMICDAEKPMCIAGVFGGLHSGVTETTTSIFLESACFEPVHVRKTSKHHQLKTDSSFRFERGTDPDMVIPALQRAVYLLEEIAEGKVASRITDIYPVKAEAKEIAFSLEYCDRIIGKSIDRNAIRKILKALGIEIVNESKDAYLLAVPPFKVDVTRPADIVEEILRIYGYNNIAFPEKLSASLNYAPVVDAEYVRERVSDHFASGGFTEILNNSLTREAYLSFNGPGSLNPVHLLNPLSSDLGIMRTTLLYGGLESIRYNVNRKVTDLRMFEFGNVYLKKEQTEDGKWPYIEMQRMIILMCGRKHPESWNTTSDALSFFDIKKEVMQLFAKLGFDQVNLKSAERADCSDVFEISIKKKNAGVIGRVAPKVLKEFDLSSDVWFAEFDWDAVLQLLRQKDQLRYAEVSKFPAVRRDLALVMDKNVAYAEVEQLAWSAERKLLKEVNLFDVYEGEKIGADKKSYAVSFILQDQDATLTDQQIDKIMQKLQKTFTEKLGAVIRS
ncbi:MAG: phenylalanine--tRNA ligase subunit beta [Bacteroidia bacterium]